MSFQNKTKIYGIFRICFVFFVKYIFQMTTKNNNLSYQSVINSKITKRPFTNDFFSSIYKYKNIKYYQDMQFSGNNRFETKLIFPKEFHLILDMIYHIENYIRRNECMMLNKIIWHGRAFFFAYDTEVHHAGCTTESPKRISSCIIFW